MYTWVVTSGLISDIRAHAITLHTHTNNRRWLPTKEALEANNEHDSVCTLLVRFEKAEHAAVALLRDGEAVPLGGGLGLMSIRLTVRVYGCVYGWMDGCINVCVNHPPTAPDSSTQL